MTKLFTQHIPVCSAARRFAAHAHGSINQRRKYTGEPYIFHPISVARRLWRVGADPALIAAGLLHDTIEDTPVTHQDILRNFGARIADLVLEVTAVSRPQDGNRRQRAEIELAHLAQISPEGKTLKLADIIDNCLWFPHLAPKFAKVYLPEKARLLPRLSEGNSVLYEQAHAILLSGLDTLGIQGEGRG